ncbi:hypothetical protein PENARI_c005G06283 [Penicillium arizonense]|uniref:Uncharacterized protein n=1 Tax=Penicillium arizonense TaxID=1835702 RepID=A0A1F5LPG7_PENAI|nr:hypothetical protein PENARI_c005G06283 [Penicillium arizonense]OGE54791.1 hypothetical protein PENARI_c005G06283 [Penicillium arizonense]
MSLLTGGKSELARTPAVSSEGSGSSQCNGDEYQQINTMESPGQMRQN